MHWGERRYQYEDGSLTPEGREHYGVGEPRDDTVSKATSAMKDVLAIYDREVNGNRTTPNPSLRDEDDDPFADWGIWNPKYDHISKEPTKSITDFFDDFSEIEVKSTYDPDALRKKKKGSSFIKDFFGF